MAKDPAFLFYSQDFLVGTGFMTMEQRGKYITLLCFQHQYGRLTENHMNNICGTYDFDIYSKFIRDDEGLYYNERLENEVLKRKKYSDSRRKNREGKKSYVLHMENENTHTVYSSLNKGGMGGIENAEYSLEHCKTVAMADTHWVKNAKATATNLDIFNKYLAGQGVTTKHIADYKKHFYLWSLKKPTQLTTAKPLKNMEEEYERRYSDPRP